jgi:hypothetical protein
MRRYPLFGTRQHWKLPAGDVATDPYEALRSAILVPHLPPINASGSHTYPVIRGTTHPSGWPERGPRLNAKSPFPMHQIYHAMKLVFAMLESHFKVRTRVTRLNYININY